MVPTKKLYENDIYIKKISSLLSELKITHNKIDNYLLAFVHRSLVNEKPDLSNEHNERLEFLGDAVLELVITAKLYSDYTEKPEGELTDMRSAIVKGKNLSQISRKLKFSEYLILGKGEELGGGRNNDYLLANCVEAFIGAIYLDLGFEEAKNFILNNIYSDLEKILSNNDLKDYKSLIQEFTQRVFYITPEYKVLSESGQDHDKIFISGIFLKEKQIGEGTGSSKKKSQEDAAKNAYLHYTSNSKNNK